ncbi:MAG: LysR family transcriptional regulator [Comamonadaceae bacterium]|nr:LysR family transcriptional regulator [Comamonadaceae bacterium]
MNVTFRQLRVFAEVARHGSFAARRRGAAPDAAGGVACRSRSSRAQVGLPLFDRARPARSALTTAGEYFLVYARRMLGTLKEAEDAMARFARLETGALTIGMVSTAKYFLPRLLAQLPRPSTAASTCGCGCGNREQLVRADAAQRGRPVR